MGDAIGSHLTAAISGAGPRGRGSGGEVERMGTSGAEQRTARRETGSFFYYWRWRWARSDFGKYYVQDYRSLVRRVIHGCLFFF